MGFQALSHGVEIIEGLPGSGKSFFGVELALQHVQAGRPVYTNLPLRMKVFRQYLRNRGGPRLANLIRPLTKEHFERFCERCKRRQDVTDSIRHRRLCGEQIGNRAVVRLVDEAIGEPVYADEYANGEVSVAANDIPAGAVIIIDEVQHWFPMRNQMAESPFLLSYLSMHRHYWHRLYFLTQDRSRISITIRLYAQKFWHVRNLADDRVAWALTWGTFGLQGFRYACYTPDQEELISRGTAKPCLHYARFPWMKQHSWKFRLYRSYTHAGSAASLRKSLEVARRAAGLDEHGIDKENEETLHAIESTTERKVPMYKILARTGILATLLGFAALAGFGVGYVVPAPAEQSVSVADGLADAVPAAAAGFEPGRISSMGCSSIRVVLGAEVDTVRRGGEWANAALSHIDCRRRVVVWHYFADDTLWVQRLGDERPTLLGSRIELEIATAAASRLGDGAAQSDHDALLRSVEESAGGDRPGG